MKPSYSARNQPPFLLMQRIDRKSGTNSRILSRKFLSKLLMSHQIEGEVFLFTSESVGEGHPDKICDQVSDAVLDACLAADPFSRVACETAAKTGMIMVLGEITTKANLDYQKIIRDTVKSIGYDDSSKVDAINRDLITRPAMFW